jgi:hypothetical protein
MLKQKHQANLMLQNQRALQLALFEYINHYLALEKTKIYLQLSVFMIYQEMSKAKDNNIQYVEY